MRTLTTLFEAEKNKKTGAKPVWILKIPFVAGTRWLSDREVTIAADLLNENCSNISDWTDADVRGGVSEISPPGRFRFDTNLGAATNDYASRTILIDSPPDQFTIEIKTYFDSIGTFANTDYFTMRYSTATWRLAAIFATNGLFIVKAAGATTEVGNNVVKYGATAAWQTWRFEVDKSGGEDAATVEVFLDGVSQGTFACDYEITSTDKLVTMMQTGSTTDNMVTHIDYVKIMTGLGEITTTLPWISQWGQIDENIANDLSLSIVSDFPLNIIIDPEAATNIEDLFTGETVETLECTLYLWFEGLDCDTDPPLPIWVGNIIEKKKISELLYDVRLADEGVRVDKNVGTVLSLADHPNASLDDVGYTLNILYGAVEKVPARRLDVGKKTSLIAAIDDNDTDFYLTEGTGFANGTSMMIGSEQIDITTISANHITACTRGVGTTDPASHSAGELVLEKQATCVFSYADQPVKSIGNIYALRKDGVPVDVTSLCTKYTGQGGANDLAGYAGKAVITCPGYITFSLAVSLGLVDTIGVTSTPTPSTASGFTLCTGGPVEVRDNDLVSDALSFPGAGSSTKSNKAWEISWNYWVQSLPTGSDEEITIDFPYNSHTHLGKMTSTGFVAYVGSPLIVAEPSFSLNGGYNAYLRADGGGSGGTWGVTVSNAKAIYTETASVSSSKTGGVTGSVSGGDVMIGDNILISGEGYQDDGSGTFTGTASALIERPDHIFKHFLYTQAAWPVADFSTDAATPFAADSYAFSVVINELKKLREWLSYMARQCRCRFRFSGGKAYLLYRPDTLSSDKTITAVMTMMHPDHTTSLQIIPPSLDEILNKIDLHYQRDWTKSAGKEAYQAVWKESDATSIGVHGEKEWANFFLFDFVRDATMAADVGGFYLAHYKDLKKYIECGLFLDNCEIEFADGVTFAALSNLLCEVYKAGSAPGNALENDRIPLIAREY